MRGLPPHRPLPGDAEPGEILIDRGLEFRPAAGRVDVLDPKQEPAARLPRQIEIQQRRIGVAEMQIAVRAGGKTENGWHRSSHLVIAGLDPAIHPLRESLMRVCSDMRWMRRSSPRMTMPAR